MTNQPTTANPVGQSEVFTKQCPSAAARSCEARDLRALREAVDKSNARLYVSVPELERSISTDGKRERLPTDLRMTLIRRGPVPRDARREAMRKLGMGLAELHRSTFTPCDDPAVRYGASESNFIGLGDQPNSWCESWGEFFFTHRLEAKAKMIRNTVVRDKFVERLNLIRDHLIAYLDANCDGACLLHGDLWKGNAIVDRTGRGWLIDPASYYGDREADLAMTEMFGGFPQEFYDGYESVWPRSKDYRAKVPIYNLYHYLNHLILFGNGYMRGCLDNLQALERTVAPHDLTVSG